MMREISSTEDGRKIFETSRGQVLIESEAGALARTVLELMNDINHYRTENAALKEQNQRLWDMHNCASAH